MKPFIYAVILGIVSCTASGQVPTAAGGASATPGPVTQGEQGTVKILVPRAGAKLNATDSKAAKDSAPQVPAANFPAVDSPAAEEKRKEEAVLETHEAAGPSLPGQAEPVKSVEPPDAAGAPSLDDLPGTGSHLPLLSLIGFGVLVGGVIAALKNR